MKKDRSRTNERHGALSPVHQDGVGELESLETLMRDDALMAPPDAVVPNFGYRRSITTLSGPPGAGKTTAAAGMVSAVTNGIPFGDESCHQGDAVWLSGGDEPLSITVQRFQQFGVRSDRLLVSRSVENPLKLYLEALTAGPDLLVIDSATSWFPRCLDVPTTYNALEWHRFLYPFVEALRESETALILINHTSEDGSTDRGSYVIRATADLGIRIKAAGDARTFYAGMNGRLPFSEVTLLQEDSRFWRRGAPALLKARIRKLLREVHPEGATKSQVREVQGTNSHIDRALEEMLEAGEVANVSSRSNGHCYRLSQD